MPDRRRHRPAGLLLAEARRLIEADPNDGHQVWREAGEPGIVEVLGGARLAGDRPVQTRPGGRAGAATDDVLHHRDHLESAGGVGDLGPRVREFGRLGRIGCCGGGRQRSRLRRWSRRAGTPGTGERVGAPDHLAFGVLNAIDQRRRHGTAAFREPGIGAGQPQHRRLHRAEGSGQHMRHRIGDVETGRRGGDGVHADAVGHAQGHQIQRLHQRHVQRHRAGKIHLVVVRPPLPRLAEIDDERRVEEALARCNPLLHRGEIDERLETRPGLAVCLGGTVELAELGAPAAGEGKNASGAGIERNQRPLHLWNLPQRQPLRLGRQLAACRRRLLRLDQDHVAGDEHIAHPPRRRAEAPLMGRVLVLRPGPAGLGEQHRRHVRGRLGAQLRGVWGPFEPAEPRRGIATLQHHRQTPAGQHAGNRRQGCKLLGPVARQRRVVEMGDRATPAAVGPIIGHQPGMQGAVGGILQMRIEAGADHQPALGGAVGAEAGDEVAAHLLGEIGRAGRRSRPARRRRQQRRRLRRRGVRRGNDPVLRHAVQNPIPPHARRLGVAERVVIVRRLGERRQHRRLGQGQRVERLGEIGLRRCGDAVGALTEIDLVQIEFENPLLAQALLDAHRQERLTHLARERDLATEQHVLRDLLGDGRGALGPPPLVQVGEIGQCGAEDRNRIDAGVGPEILILG